MFCMAAVQRGLSKNVNIDGLMVKMLALYSRLNWPFNFHVFQVM